MFFPEKAHCSVDFNLVLIGDLWFGFYHGFFVYLIWIRVPAAFPDPGGTLRVICLNIVLHTSCHLIYFLFSDSISWQQTADPSDPRLVLTVKQNFNFGLIILTKL